MAIQTFNPPIPPTEGTSVTQKANLLKAEFGDGYTQTVRVGLQHMRRSIKLSWALLHPDDALVITDFLRDHGGYTSFLYTPSDDLDPVKWTCVDWNDTRIQGGYRSIQATFEECFDDRSTIEYVSGIGVANGKAGFNTVGRSDAEFAAVAEATGTGNAWGMITTFRDDQVAEAAGVGSATAVGQMVKRANGAAAGVGTSVVSGTAMKPAQAFAFGLGSAQAVGTTA